MLRSLPLKERRLSSYLLEGHPSPCCLFSPFGLYLHSGWSDSHGFRESREITQQCEGNCPLYLCWNQGPRGRGNAPLLQVDHEYLRGFGSCLWNRKPHFIFLVLLFVSSQLMELHVLQFKAIVLKTLHCALDKAMLSFKSSCEPIQLCKIICGKISDFFQWVLWRLCLYMT